MIRNTTRNQKLGWVFFILYLLLVVYVMFFAEYLGRGGQRPEAYHYNLTLFKEIQRFYQYRHIVGMDAFLLNVFGNILAFVPFGFFLPIVSRRGRYWYNTLLLTFSLSLMIEVIQLIGKVGSFDVDDLFLNTIGGVVGYIVYQVIQKIRRRMHEAR